MKPSKRKAVFLDRDGTLIKDFGYVSRPQDVVLYQSTIAGLSALKARGFLLIVVTNQSGLGRGYFSSKQMSSVNARLRFLLKRGGVSLDGMFICPHRPEEKCECRKPKTGLVREAMKRWPIDLSGSYMVGDHQKDIQLAKAMGIGSVLLLTGKGRLFTKRAKADFVAGAIGSAARWIVKQAGEEKHR